MAEFKTLNGYEVKDQKARNQINDANEKIKEMDNDLLSCIEKSENLQNQINSLASGSPKGSYATANDLKNDNPDTGVYIITSNGHIYSWVKDSTEAPIDLGVYQATKIADESITPFMFDEKNKKINKIRVPEITIVNNEFVRYSETIQQTTNTARTEPFQLQKGETIVFSAKGYVTNVAMISVCSLDKSMISMVARSIDNSYRTYEYTALNDCYVMLSWIPTDNIKYYIYCENELNNFYDTVETNDYYNLLEMMIYLIDK